MQWGLSDSFSLLALVPPIPFTYQPPDHWIGARRNIAATAIFLVLECQSFPHRINGFQKPFRFVNTHSLRQGGQLVWIIVAVVPSHAAVETPHETARAEVETLVAELAAVNEARVDGAVQTTREPLIAVVSTVPTHRLAIVAAIVVEQQFQRHPVLLVAAVFPHVLRAQTDGRGRRLPISPDRQVDIAASAAHRSNPSPQ